MNTTDEQIKTVEAIRKQRGLHSDPQSWMEADTLTALLSEFHEMRELLEAAAQIVIVNGDLPDGGTKAHSLFNVGTGWIIDSNRDNDKEYDSALDAWREVKGENNG